ncbi:efflux RND transporter periplasmic adaptor subunit [Pistricoccus aurantiacus]|uniref:efflux RND transporter periplasmic adaptor subunit n=1 Tax=Pistricoccus aurantiacus TaxID=1883414 RepID=UPI0036309E98
MPRRSTVSYLLAVVLTLLLLLWLAFGNLQAFRDEAPESAAQEDDSAGLARVEVRLDEAQDYQPTLLAQGNLSARQAVDLRARIEGRVQRLPVKQGARVEEGTVLLELDQEDLPQQLARAQAELESAQAEYEGARSLEKRDLISRTELLKFTTELAQAQAEAASLREALAKTRPQAPFTGILDRLDVDPGDSLQVGESYGLLIDPSQLKAEAQIPQRDAQGLEPGLEVEVTLLDGRTLEGELTHVANQANPQTRSFAVEALIDNPDSLRLAGASATLRIARPSRQAHALSPALLVLDDKGRLGVKAVDDQQQVVFHPVTLLSATSERAWVSGIPEKLRLITLGGGFVEPGERVEVVDAASPQES